MSLLELHVGELRVSASASRRQTSGVWLGGQGFAVLSKNSNVCNDDKIRRLSTLHLGIKFRADLWTSTATATATTMVAADADLLLI